MKSLIRIVQTYLLCGLPLVLICMAWGSLHDESEIVSTPSLPVRLAWEILSWNLMAWFAILIFFLLALVFSGDARENTLTRLARIRERDEREEFITGRASRAAYVSGLALLIALLFFSMFSLHIVRPVGGERGSLSLSMGFSLWDKPTETVDAAGGTLLEVRQLPLSKAAILLTLLIWQIGAFALSARRESRTTFP